MEDRVHLLGLEVEAPIGVYDFEKGILQKLHIDVVASCDLRRSAASDALADTLDYDRFAAICREVCASKHHQLIETIAETVAQRVRSEFGESVSAVEVRVEKPGAVPDARTVAVTIRR